MVSESLSLHSKYPHNIRTSRRKKRIIIVKIDFAFSHPVLHGKIRLCGLILWQQTLTQSTVFGVAESIPLQNTPPASCRSFSPGLHPWGNLWGTRRERCGKCFRGMARRRTRYTGAPDFARIAPWRASTPRQYQLRNQILTSETRAREVRGFPCALAGTIVCDLHPRRHDLS